MYIHITQTWIKRLYNLDSQPVFAQPSSESTPTTNTMYVCVMHNTQLMGCETWHCPYTQLYLVLHPVSTACFGVNANYKYNVCVRDVQHPDSGLWNMTLPIYTMQQVFLLYLVSHPASTILFSVNANYKYNLCMRNEQHCCWAVKHDIDKTIQQVFLLSLSTSRGVKTC